MTQVLKVMYKKEKNKKIELNIKNMGIDIDKNEYREIVLSNSNRPEAAFCTKNVVKKYKNNSK